MCLKGAETRGEDDNVFMVVIVFYFSKEQGQGEKKRHEDDNCVLLSLCLRGVGKEGEDEAIDRCRFLLFFTRAMTRRNMMT